MELKAFRTELKDILPLRDLFLQETNFQVRYNACHERGWTDSYLLTLDNIAIGYGSVKGQEMAGRDTVFEFYVTPPFRKYSSLIFSELLTISKVVFIECQSNDLLLSAMLYEFGENINADVVLFGDHIVTELIIPGVIFRKARFDDQIFDHYGEPKGDYILEINGGIVATGGFMLHYNKPFADLYMEVKEEQRRKGFGSFLLQEVKKECYLNGRVPAARCNIKNIASKATLLKAGLKISGYMLMGGIKKSNS
jgi:GNAT superfamily N-acetyltransferase